MPTREEISGKIRRDLAERGVTPSDPLYEFLIESMEAMNLGMADLDDELADLATRLDWLANTPTWINQREIAEFDRFVAAKLGECETALVAIRHRWENHEKADQIAPTIPP
jgi:hypothetical protein